jgi:hypothetical protein
MRHPNLLERMPAPSLSLHAHKRATSRHPELRGETLTLLSASLLSASEAPAGVRTGGSPGRPRRRRTPPRSGPESESADADAEPASGSRSRLTWV